MAPPPSHSQSLLPNPEILILDRVERDADRFRLIVHVGRNRFARSAKNYRARGTVAIAVVSRIFPGSACLSSYGQQSVSFAVEIPRAPARFSVSGCLASHAFTDAKPRNFIRIFQAVIDLAKTYASRPHPCWSLRGGLPGFKLEGGISIRRRTSSEHVKSGKQKNGGKPCP
jgi:hypothetical protein